MKIGYIMQEGGPDVRQRPLTGPANHVLKVYQNLSSLGHSMLFLARYDGIIWKSVDLESFDRVETPRVDVGLRHLVERFVRGLQSRLGLPYANLFESLRFAEACWQVMSDRDILYERMGWMGWGGGLAAKQLGIPLVLEANNGDFITELERLGVAPQGFQRWMAVELMRRAAHRSNHIIATGDGHRNRFIEWYRMPSDRVTTVENGSDIVFLLEREQLSSFIDPKPQEHPVTIIFVGAFEPWHGILVLLQAFAHVLEKTNNIRLVLVGSGTQLDVINKMIAELNLESKIELTGQLNINQVANRLAVADIGVAPYCGWMEFSGLKLFDYKSAGLAIVTSGTNGQPATIEQGVTGLIVPPCEEKPLADALYKLVTDSELRRSLGRKARKVAEDSHSWMHTANQLVQVFERFVRI